MTDWMAAAERAATVAAAHAAQGDELRRLPIPVVDVLKDEGLLRMCVPHTYGGPEVDPPTMLRVIERMAQIDCEAVRRGFNARASIGAAIYPEDGETDAALMQAADIAMYAAKAAGKGRLCMYSAELARKIQSRLQLEQGLCNALSNDEFFLVFQPRVSARTGALVCGEALLRWRHPERGMVSPSDFIPLAEEIGLIAELSESLIRLALEDAKAWDSRLTLAVNISPLQLRDPWFAQRLLKMLVAANFPPTRLEIEITETCLHENVGVVRSLITSLKNQGISISLDDFGTGYSSLAQLRTLPFDQIKIDRSFVSSLAESSDSASIVEAISSLGRGMALPITAEGIETADVLSALRRYGKFKGQGYLYGRPASAEDVRRELAEHGLLKVGTEAAPAAPGPTAPAARLA